VSDGALAYVGLGTNLGEGLANLRRALALLAATPGIAVRRVASVYRTAPQGYVDQDWFLNTVAEVRTALPPLDLLGALQAVEAGMGRVRTIRWGPRVIDLDLLLYGEERVEGPQLTVPHPRLAERAFVLVPLAELIPDRELAPGQRVREMAARLAEEQPCEPLGEGKELFPVLQPGITGEERVLVTPDNTASAHGSGAVPVFATPALVALMEKAARLSVQPALAPGQTTVGTRVEIRHLAATPEGMTVTARSELVAVEGKRLVFKVEASDEVETVGTGTHERYVVWEESFLKKAMAKKNRE